MKISVIIATYNEIENLKTIVEDMDNILRKEYEIVVVDDNSPDGTFELAQEIAKDYPLKCLKRDKKLGLASAVVYGFEHASGDILGVIDADLQHPPELIKELIKVIKEGCDIAHGFR